MPACHPVRMMVAAVKTVAASAGPATMAKPVPAIATTLPSSRRRRPARRTRLS